MKRFGLVPDAGRVAGESWRLGDSLFCMFVGRFDPWATSS